MENLSKEYFERLESLYPKAVADFRRYIDDYKVAINWPVLFNEGVKTVVTKTDTTKSVSTDLNYTIKYHDIPFALQIGVVYIWVYEMYDNSPNLLFPDPDSLFIDGVKVDKVKRNIEFMISFIETIL